MLSKQTAFTQQLASGPMFISNCYTTLRMQSQNQSRLTKALCRRASADADQTSLFSDDQHFSAAGQALLAAYDFSLLKVVSRIFRTFDQATASVCMSCG